MRPERVPRLEIVAHGDAGLVAMADKLNREAGSSARRTLHLGDGPIQRGFGGAVVQVEGVARCSQLIPNVHGEPEALALIGWQSIDDPYKIILDVEFRPTIDDRHAESW